MSQIGVNDLASKRILLRLIPLLPLSADGITRMQGSLLSVVCLFQGACGELKDHELSLGEEGARESCDVVFMVRPLGHKPALEACSPPLCVMLPYSLSSPLSASPFFFFPSLFFLPRFLVIFIHSHGFTYYHK